MDKVCSKCKEEKPLGEFHKQRMGKLGRQGQCKACFKQYREANKEKFAEYRKQYYEENKEKVLEQKKQYRKANKEKMAEKDKLYYEANKEKIAERTKQWREENREKINEYVKNRRKNNEQVRIIKGLYDNLYWALKKGKRKNPTISTYLGCSIEQLQEYLRATSPQCGGDLHIDHIIPCALFDHA